MPNLSPYRKALIAALAAAVTIAQAFGFPLAEGLSDNIVAVFDALAAVAVYAVPNQ